MRLSIVTTLYRSSSHLDEFYARVHAQAKALTEDFELIFVNDGSPDNSLQKALEIFQQDQRVKILDLSRNFGHHKAMMTGLAASRGELIYLVDSDLEEQPEWLSEFFPVLKREGADVVFGVQNHRKGGLFERLSGRLFFWLFNIMSEYPIPKNLLTSRLMTRRYVNSLLEHREREMVISGLWQITGYKQIPVKVNKQSLNPSNYRFTNKATIFVNAVTSFSSFPLVVVFYLGLMTSGLAFLMAVYMIIQRLFFDILLVGWPSLIASVWLLGGLTIFSIGLVGIYLSRIFIETKRRPYTIVREVYEHTGQSQQRSDG